MSSPDEIMTIPSPAPAESAEAEPTRHGEHDAAAFALRYSLGDKLGEGGMGVVRSCRDLRIGREIAFKTTRPDAAVGGDLVARFVREACVQGQLEHPSIVPVYDLDRDPEGNVYFTMKRVRGATLEQVVAWLRDGDESTRRRYSRRKLLVAFASVCQALHFAHARGVVHRDLKPGNVMLGDYGEVYVLDWGLAKLLSTREVDEPSAEAPASSGQTQRGATMGTPGFMSPEQVTGEDVDARADVYALGAILFELLALEPLHARGSAEAMYTSTLLGANARPSARAPGFDVPPELDAICVRATMVSRDARFGSVRELLDAVEQFLDGDRDMQRRREVAAGHAQAAAAHLERALSAQDDEAASRSRALQEVGRAITFDPTNADALRTLVRLLTDPPRDVPPEARAEFSRAQTTHLATGGRAAGYAFLTWFLYAPLSILMGVRSWAATAVVTAAWILAAIVSFASARRPPPDGKASVPILLAGSLAISCTAALFGPYFFVPGVAVIYGMMFTLVPPDPARRPFVVALCIAEIAVPVVLSWMHVLPQPYEIRDDAVTIHAGMLHFPPLPTQAFLLLTSIVVVITACVMAATVRDALSAAESRLHVQAWQLRQILPPEAHRASSADSTGSERAD